MKQVKTGKARTPRRSRGAKAEMPAGAMAPYTQWRVVKWGECDPAGVTYTPRTLDWAVEAVEGWTRDAIGMAWIPLNYEKGYGTPMVRAEVDFKKAMRPDLEFRVELRVEKLGTASIDYRVDGYDAQDNHYFTVRLVSCLINRKNWKAAPFPAAVRKRIVAYRKACGAPK